MAKFGTNYGESFKLCPLCKQHEDSQEMCFKQCQEIRTTEVTTCNYEDIFKKPPTKLAKVLKSIEKIRER